MVKISMISTLPPIKGLSPYTLGLVKEISKKCEVDFYGFKSIYPEFLYPGGTKTKEKEPSIKKVNIENSLTWYNPFSWIKTGFKINTSILHVQWWSWFLAPMYLTILSIVKLRGKKIIMTIHNVKPHEKSFVKNFLNSSVISLADEYIVHSKENKKQFVKEIKTNKKINVIPLGLEIKRTINKGTSREKLGLSKKEIILLFFGNIRDYKGLDVLIKSFYELDQKDIKLLVAGQIWDKEILNLIKDDGRIICSKDFIPKDKVIDYFSASDLVIFPYKYFDASSAAGADAISFGKPIVVTSIGGLPELVKNNKVIAKPNNVNDLTAKIEYALKNLKKLGKDSKEKAKEFSWKEIANKTLEVYRG